MIPDHSFSDFPCLLAAIISSSRLQTVSIQCLGKGQGCKSHLQSSGNSLEGVNHAGGVGGVSFVAYGGQISQFRASTSNNSFNKAGPMSPEKQI